MYSVICIVVIVNSAIVHCITENVLELEKKINCIELNPVSVVKIYTWLNAYWKICVRIDQR